MNELATQQGHLFSRDENNALEHHPDEKCSRLVKIRAEETHSEFECSFSFLRSHFRFQKNKGLQPCL